jgi:penicillin-binding protein 2
MAYRGRRKQRPVWPTLLVSFVAIAVVLVVARRPVQSAFASVVERLNPVVPASLRQTANRAGIAPPAPTFTVTIDRSAPLANVPSPADAASAYLAAWAEGRYSDMYDLLASDAKASLTRDAFTQRYQAITAEASITKIAGQITSTPLVAPGLGNGASVQVPFTVAFTTIRVGAFQENNSVPLVLEDGSWRVDWQPSLYFKDLAPDDLVRLFPLNPRRGSILDRQGRPLATMGFQETIGVVPKELSQDGHEQQVLGLVGGYVHKSPDDLKKIYQNQPPEWFIPLGDVAGNLETELHQKFGDTAGVYLRRKPIRVYPEGELAAHIVGYVGHVDPSELPKLVPQGYTIDDIVGRAGVEGAAQSVLAGTRGGKLAVVAPTGEVIKVIAEREAVPGDDVVLSLDLDVQKAAEKVLGKLDGSVVVMDPSDNTILAMASYPRFDPNKFVLGFTPQEWNALNTSPDTPFQNRPVEAAFPTGSIFKVITMSAGMESAGYRPSDTFDCNYWWHGLPGVSMHNWAVQGTLNLIQSLTGSCDPTFYTIGLALQRKDPFLLPNMARGYGLGQKTGVYGVNEVAGTVPDPKWKEQTLKQAWYPGDGVNLAIGQGFLQATPLQMANAYAAIAANGVRRTPILIQKYVDQHGDVAQTFTAQTVGRVPISATTLKALHDGMLGVTSTPLGTAYYAFSSYRHPIEAKTGSAENQNVLAHAWLWSRGAATATRLPRQWRASSWTSCCQTILARPRRPPPRRRSCRSPPGRRLQRRRDRRPSRPSRRRQLRSAISDGDSLGDRFDDWDRTSRQS